jgi:hypothetical protein
MNFAEIITQPQSLSVGDEVRVLAPISLYQDLGSFLSATENLRPVLRPFSSELCEIVVDLGREILRLPILKRDTGAVALAFWMRNANVERIRDSFFSHHLLNDQVLIVPVGRVFHLAPANVDTIFLYSWVLSFLCGNVNIVRLSSVLSPVCEGLLESIEVVMGRHAIFREQNLFMTCTHGSRAIAQCSMWCSHRVIWGGDNSIAQIRPTPIPTHASERVFGTKYSYAVICSEKILGGSDGEVEVVSQALFNDIFQFNQRACSSPHLIFWIGDPVMNELAIKKLEGALLAVVQNRKYESTISEVVQRFSQACSISSESSSKVNWHGGVFTSVVQSQISPGEEKGSCGGGFVRHVSICTVDELSRYVSPSDQTVTYYGLNDDQLQVVAEACGTMGVDRVVPVGQALDFSPIWDGFDLIGDLIRRVQVIRNRVY